jgi:DNA-binding response OmpR family regulator
MRILIAERDPHFRRMLEHMLMSWQYQAISSTSGPEALALLESAHAPEVALLDSAMPVVDGFQLCRRIREASGAPLASTYIIMLLRRSITIRDVFAASLDAGADDYICKPFDPEELRARLRVGAQVIALRRSLGARERELEATTVRVKELQTLLLERHATREAIETAMAAPVGLGAR